MKFFSSLRSVLHSCIMIDVDKLRALKQAAIHGNWAAAVYLCRELSEDVEGSPERFLVGLLPPAVRREDVPGVT